MGSILGDGRLNWRGANTLLEASLEGSTAILERSGPCHLAVLFLDQLHGSFALYLVGSSKATIGRRPGVGSVTHGSIQELDVKEGLELTKPTALARREEVAPDHAPNLVVLQERRVFRGHTVFLRPCHKFLFVGLHKGNRAVHSAISIHHDAASQRVDKERVAKLTLHVLQRHILSAQQLDEVLLAVHNLDRAVGSPLANVACGKPPLIIDGQVGLLGLRFHLEVAL
mmetsp:Transcript_79001/g.115690  ORF Transcript_79001/g.115690 Transcript_79001/m.115690 type:complete len:227 (-) Transcript_79001:1704-2384(-)